MIDALDAGHEAIRGIIDQIDKLAEAAGKPKLERRNEGAGAGCWSARRRARCSAPLAEAMRIRDKLENYAAVDRVLDRPPGDPAGRRRGAPRRRQDRLQGPEGAGAAGRGPRTRPTAGRPQVRRDPDHHRRRRHAAAHPRLGRVHPRRDAGPWSPRPSAPPTTSRRSNWSTARCTAVSCCTTTSRRSRWARSSSCGARAAARSATATSPSAACCRSCPAKRRSPTRYAWSPTSWSRTGRRRWPRCAAARWP